MVLDPLIGTVARVLPTTSTPSSDLSRRFRAGQTLKGVVLRALPEGQTLVNFAGQYVLLELDQSLIKGQTFLATVEQVSPTLLLKVVDDPAARALPQPGLSATLQEPVLNHPDSRTGPPGTLDATRLKSYLMTRQPFGTMATELRQHLGQHPLLRALDPTLLQRLEETLDALLPRDVNPPDAAGLKEQVERSGINYEAKVHQVLSGAASPAEQDALANDLKGQLLDFQHKLDQELHQHASKMATPAQRGALAALHQDVQHALQNIEYQQLANLFAHQEDQSLLLQFLHPAFPTTQTAKLYFRANHQQQGALQDGPQDYTLVFLLDFTALGPIRIDATVHDASVTATIRTEDETVAAFLTAQSPSLNARLHEIGFQADVRCWVQKQVPLDIDDSLTRLLMKDPSRVLDITA